ncbi:helix-turn-helix domain-containing protein [Neobacillus vireti]|uniref:XRE family transcriptional regulator n=1 Tax=Neobacillus vireti LMG 21834 TaxID=1131730 RepID=A0AB94IKM7_9BACI|nr:XRE family transcriptional regulator [Neobacillus vireti LMG 21834]KLT18451.1 XRE family transcriptional regulator [Neobacillus vireti]
MNSIGHTIKTSREMLKMTQQELAQKVRVGTHTIEKYESGEQIPSTQTIMKLSTVLDIPASELLKYNQVQTTSTSTEHI